MEKLILKCGRYIPPAAGDAEQRVKSLESYLAGLTQELEFLVGELDRTLEAMGSAAAHETAAEAVILSENREEGSV